MTSYGVCRALGARVPEGGTKALEANPACVCPTAMAAMFCATGHMLECHYPMSCSEADCGHYQREMEIEEFLEADAL